MAADDDNSEDGPDLTTFKCCRNRKSNAIYVCIKCESMVHNSCLGRKKYLILGEARILCCHNNLTYKSKDLSSLNPLEIENYFLNVLVEQLFEKSKLYEEKLEKLEKEKIETKNNQEMLSSKPVVRSYANAVKTKPEPVLIIKPKNEQTSDVTKKNIRQKVNPGGINISKFQQVTKGAVVIGCDSKNEINELQTKITKELGDNYTVQVPVPKKPKIKIINVNSEDVCVDDSEESIVDQIIKDNSINNGEDFHMKVLKISENTHKNINIILEY